MDKDQRELYKAIEEVVKHSAIKGSGTREAYQVALRETIKLLTPYQQNLLRLNLLKAFSDIDSPIRHEITLDRAEPSVKRVVVEVD